MIRAFAPELVRSVEKRAVDGAPEDALMERAARGVADAAGRLAGPTGMVLALVGGGDNGGDALMAAAMLAGQDQPVAVALLGEHPRARALARARNAGVDVRALRLPLEGGTVPDWMCADLWIDGLTGTGLRGTLREPLASAVAALADAARRWGTRVVAVDVPSGVAGADGTLSGVVLPATHTVTMGALKTSLVLPPAALEAGSVEVVDLGIDPGTQECDDTPGVWRPEAHDVAGTLVVPGPRDHKYTRGVVTVAAGSATYPGAGVLAVEGALGVGPGMVRLESESPVSALVLARHPGVVTMSGRSQAVVIGSGLDTSTQPRARAIAESALAAGLPVVLDAGALALVPDLVRSRGGLPGAVLTPHAGEAASLLAELVGERIPRAAVEARSLEVVRRLVALTGATVLLKGGVTLVGAPDGRMFSVPGGPGWTGVAGAGDVLAGVLGGLAAQGRAREELGGPRMDLPVVAASAAWIHARAAARASGVVDEGGRARGIGHPIQAADIAVALPGVVEEVLEVEARGRCEERAARWRGRE